MPAPITESMIRKTPKAPSAAAVAINSPRPPVSPENGDQFAAQSMEKTGISRVDDVARERNSRHEALAAGELIGPAGDDGAEEHVGWAEPTTRVARRWAQPTLLLRVKRNDREPIPSPRASHVPDVPQIRLQPKC